jgi:hypothetical protein
MLFNHEKFVNVNFTLWLRSIVIRKGEKLATDFSVIFAKKFGSWGNKIHNRFISVRVFIVFNNEH